MKKLKLSPQDKEKLLAEFSEQIEAYEDDMTEDSISFEKKFKTAAKEKITIIFTPDAYLRSLMLVKSFTGEVGWNGLMQKIDAHTYRIYDIMVYPQVVNGARTLDPTATNDWYDKYDDVLDYMFYQAHSHVNMSTSPSDTDMQNQANMVKNMQGAGFRLFQIWNKQGDINSFFYDIDNNLLYDRNDIVIEIETADYGTMNDFVDDAKTLAEDMKPLSVVPKPETLPATSAYGAGYQWKNPLKTHEPTGTFYWKDGMGHEGWD